MQTTIDGDGTNGRLWRRYIGPAMNEADQTSTSNDDDLGHALDIPSEWSILHDHVRRVDLALQDADPQATPDLQAVMDLRDQLFVEIHARWLPPFPYSPLWPPSWYIPVDADWRTFGAMYSEPPSMNRYAHDWTMSKTDPITKASRYDGNLAVFSASRPNEDYRKQEAGIGVIYSPTFAYGTVRVVPEIICSAILRTRMEMYPMLVSGSVRVTASIVVAQWQVIPNGYDLVRHYTVPIASTGWVDQSHGPNWHNYQVTPPASQFSQPFVVERHKRYLFGVVARVETNSTLLDQRGQKIPRFEGNVFNLWGQHSAAVPRIKVTTVRRYIL